MGVLLLYSDHRIDSRLQESNTNVVTLLIPEAVLLRYPERDRRNLPKRIPELLRRYGKFLTATKRLGKKAGRTLYQPSPGKEKMKRINVRLSTGSWTLFGTLAQAHGVSRCFLFNYLLWLEENEIGNSIVQTMNEGGPTFHRKYSYILDLDLLNNRVSRLLQCEPEDSFYVLDYRDWFRTAPS
ncbi:DUF1564 domain-containing protein [Leptospira sp. FAT2]|uniref:DUF1564 domain-containing protein n=1 Tax=Leptospira sanjuanensis TaxID=2879643 RepID=UPI001EE92C7B|nr:DUF1564 domain-containing protein [Leptospira sanjuanensis]MCG6168889.1 DUF1564 domain-containing protein [Leptospira sanjuanensis]MCG6194303.1 DUF1564 domain-containing protein [Leptospira sanjuanensis]